MRTSRDLTTSACPATPVDKTTIRVKGVATAVPSVQIDGRVVIADGGWLKVATVQDEELVEGEAVTNPASFVERLKASGLVADIFTFTQTLTENQPKHRYHLEWDNWAVIPITTYSEWWERQVEPSIRRAVRKAAKSGVVVKVAELGDAFVSGIVQINNETPVRQGRPFWHFQKSFEEVKEENSTYAERNIFLGAYHEGELIGFMRLTCAGRAAHVIQLLPMMKHYDKRLTNALVAKAVEVCEQRGISQLVYCNYIYNDPKSTLTEFKRRNGFEKILVPRYYIPLTAKGRAALGMRLHRGLVGFLPKPLVTELLRLRGRWYARRAAAVEGSL